MENMTMKLGFVCAKCGCNRFKTTVTKPVEGKIERMKHCLQCLTYKIVTVETIKK
jgi:hypothetical protein